MNEINDLLRKLFQRNIIGHKHVPELVMLKHIIKHLPKVLQKQFYEEYGVLLKKEYFWRLKKRTGKGSDWHISLNPEKLDEIKEYIGDDDETSNWEIL